MVDVLTPEQRKLNMSRIRGKHTRPELLVRRVLHALGYRFRLHRRDLPGTPDIVFVSRRKVINVHGCYWHMHDCHFGRVSPATNAEFWLEKRTATARRDAKASSELAALGWQELVLWECELRSPALSARLEEFLA